MRFGQKYCPERKAKREVRDIREVEESTLEN